MYYKWNVWRKSGMHGVEVGVHGLEVGVHGVDMGVHVLEVECMT